MTGFERLVREAKSHKIWHPMSEIFEDVEHPFPAWVPDGNGMVGARPRPTPETRHFWEGCRAGKLLLQRCRETGRAYFPPRPFSPYTGGRDVEIFESSGRATLYSYVIHHREVPGFVPPYAIAVVELAEGPRLMANIVGCPQTPEALVLDMPLQVVFRRLDDEISIPLFRPGGEI